MVVVGTAERGQKEIQTDWPIESGLTAGTHKQEGRQINLVAEESHVQNIEKEGMY